jgi:hypothetical protein
MTTAADHRTEPYRLRTRLPVYRRRLARAEALIHEARAIGPCSIGF